MLNLFKEYLSNIGDWDKIISPYQTKQDKLNAPTKEQIIAALCDFENNTYEILNISRAKQTSLFIRIFNKYIENKPNKVSVNRYLLYMFGFRYCYRCREIISINSFYTDKLNWAGITKECMSCAKNKWTESRNNNKDVINKKGRERYWNDRDNQIRRIIDYQKRNPHIKRKSDARYRAAKLQATPKWLIKQDWIEIEDIYWQAKEYERLLGEPFHVDHIVPLQGKNVSGLHVPWNLQILSEHENCKKGNKYKE